MDEDTGDVESGAKIRNASALPIYDVSIRWARQRTTDEELERTWSDVSFYAVGFDVIPPSDRSQLVGLPAGQGFDWDKHLWAPTRMGVQISFHDSANVRWVRRIDGTLDEDHDDAVAQEPPGWELVKVIYC